MVPVGKNGRISRNDLTRYLHVTGCKPHPHSLHGASHSIVLPGQSVDEGELLEDHLRIMEAGQEYHCTQQASIAS